MSGKGTTHNTNGIIIQKMIPCNEPTPDHQCLQKTRKRSLDPPSTNLETYIRGKRTGPEHFGKEVELNRDTHNLTRKSVQKLDGAYFLMKTAVHGKVLPSWTGFNTVIRRDPIPPPTNIGYLPVIDASPTEFGTVKTILKRSTEIADRLQLQEIVLVFDQAIYAKAQEIRWKSETYKERLTIRMGEFHTCMAFLSCIGKRFGDAGLQDILIEADVIAAGSVGGVITGHQYNRSIRSHKLMCEALHRLRRQSYLETLSQDCREAALKVAADLQSAFPEEICQVIIESQVFNTILEGYDKFNKQQESKTYRFWSSYIEMVEDLLSFIRATREANWGLHLSSIRFMLPWFFSYDRINYSRYLSAYWQEMNILKETHPRIYTQVQSGDFVAQRQQAYAFTGTACDQVIEQTANRDSKTKGGLTGFSLNKGAIHRWTLTQHERAAITMEVKDMAGQNTSTRQRTELDEKRKEQDEKDVQSILSTIHHMMNPFDQTLEKEHLYHVTSGQVASEAISADLLNAKEIGEKAFVEFFQQRLNTDEVEFHAPLKKMKLKTFKDTATSTVTKVRGREIALKADRDLFARLIVVGTVRKIDIREMLVYSLGPLPAAIANVDGSIVKTDKAKLMHFLEGSVHPPATVEIPDGSIWVCDAMALVQAMKPQNTFGRFANNVLMYLINAAKASKSKVVHFVPDTYKQMSIKNAERDRRATKGCQLTKIYSADQKTPKQWSKFLSCGDNKEQLQQFFFESWSKSRIDQIEDITLVVGHGSECHVIRINNSGTDLEVLPLPALSTIQEEADTRLLLHCAHASQYSTNIVINSPDTDVFVLAISFCREIGANIYFHTGKGENKRTIHVQQIQRHLGDKISDALIGLHCFTGCDTVSALYGVGKVKAIKTLLSNEDHCATMSRLGTAFQLPADLYEATEAFTCALYDVKDCRDVNYARSQLFKSGKCTDRSLPPNRDALHNHTQRANYQAAIYRRSLKSQPDVPPPMAHGWKIEGDFFRIDWMTLPPAPVGILELVYCSCKKTQCVKGRCTCKLSELPCTDMCLCVDCENFPN